MSTNSELILGISFWILTLIYMITVLINLIKSKRYQHMQIQMMKKFLERQGEKIDLNALYQEAKRN